MMIRLRPIWVPTLLFVQSGGSLSTRFGFHRCVPSTSRIRSYRQCSSGNHHHQRQDQPYELASDAISLLARRKKSWQRLRHLVDMASSDSSIQTIADVGTDHGLLAMALALSGRFQNVLGVDVSHQALENGAISLLEKVNQELTKNKALNINTTIPIAFRHSDGFADINPGEADAVCIAGMGVNTMLKIIKAQSDDGATSHIDRIACQQLILQATNSRPRNLMLLYDHLQTSGWSLAEERIESIASRWYISASFRRNGNAKEGVDKVLLPTSKLSEMDTTNAMFQTFQDYVDHHCNWIQKDEEARKDINRADSQWLATFKKYSTRK